MALFFDLTGFIFGMMGCGLLQFLCLNYLPKYRLKALEEAFEDAYTVFRCVVKEGLIQLESDELNLEEQLKDARRDINTVRTELAQLGSFWRQLRALIGNLSRKIGHIDRSIKELRATIISTSDKAKRELEAAGRRYNPCLHPLEASVINTRCSRTVIPVRLNDQPELPLPRGSNSNDPEHAFSQYISRHPLPRLHRSDSISSTSTTSTAVDPGSYNDSDIETLKSGTVLSKHVLSVFKPNTPYSVGMVITKMLLKNTQKPALDLDLSVQQEHRYLDELPHVKQQRCEHKHEHNKIDMDSLQHPSISKILRIPDPWARPTTGPLLPF